MKRNINNKKYADIAAKNQDALDYPKICSLHDIVIESSYWICIKNKYPYIEYDGQKCIEHFLIVPKRNEIEFYEELSVKELIELSNVLKELRTLSSDIAERKVMFKDNFRSIKKFHVHYLLLAPDMQ